MRRVVFNMRNPEGALYYNWTWEPRHAELISNFHDFERDFNEENLHDGSALIDSMSNAVVSRHEKPDLRKVKYQEESVKLPIGWRLFQARQNGEEAIVTAGGGQGCLHWSGELVEGRDYMHHVGQGLCLPASAGRCDLIFAFPRVSMLSVEPLIIDSGTPEESPTQWSSEGPTQ